MSLENLFSDIPQEAGREHFEALLEAGRAATIVRLERIVSQGQATPPGQWLDGEYEEWVVLLSGGARLRFEDEQDARELRPGDFLLIAPHRRHRVEWTEPGKPTVWLALHFERGRRRV